MADTLAETRRELASVREMWGKVLQNAPDFIFTLDRRGIVHTINRVGPAYRLRDVIGKSAYRFMAPEGKRALRDGLKRVFAGETVEFEAPAKKNRGTTAVYSYRLAPLYEGGRVVRAISITRDTTDRRKIEDALERSRQLLDSILKNAPEFVVTLDRDLVITYYNRTTKRHKDSSILGRTIGDFFAPEDRERTLAKLRRVIASGSVETYEVEALPTGGRRRWFRTTAGPMRAGGKIVGAVAVSSEITDWKSAQEELARAQGRLQGLFDGSRDALTFTDLKGRFLDVNPAFCQLVGYSRRELIGMSFDEITPPEFRAASRQAFGHLHSAGSFNEFRKEYVRKDGSKVPVAVTGFAVKGPDGRTTGFAAVIRDMTERLRLEKEILEVGAREQSRLGRELHDSLGQDMTGISLMAKALARRLAERGAPEADDARAIAEVATGAVRQTRALAAGLLPAELLTNGLPVALRELGARAEKLLGLECTVRCPDSIGRLEDISLVHIYRIAQEAVTNASKHARARRAIIDLVAKDGRLELRVRDDGKGFDAGRMDGKGLGLSIMKHRAAMVGGSLAVRRAVTGGTEVFFVCPRPK